MSPDPPAPGPLRPVTLWALDLDQPPALTTPSIPAVFVRLGVEQAGALARAMDLDPSEVYRRLASGRRCYAALLEGAPVAWAWVTVDSEEVVGEMRLRLRLAPGDAYIWSCATLPTYRRHRLFTALLSSIAAGLRDEGQRRLWIGAERVNIPSQRGAAVVGFQPVADVLVALAVGVRIPWVRALPGAPDDVVADARRALLGDRDAAWTAALRSTRTR